MGKKNQTWESLVRVTKPSLDGGALPSGMCTPRIERAVGRRVLAVHGLAVSGSLQCCPTQGPILERITCNQRCK